MSHSEEVGQGRFSTPQEEFWAGKFGDEYQKRNRGENMVAANIALFAKILGRTTGVRSVLELGANIGLNLRAIRTLRSDMTMSAVEINQQAVQELASIGDVRVFPQSILEFAVSEQWDLVFTKGVLIHLDPEALPHVYDVMHRLSSNYIALVEYYNPSPVEVSYRGHTQRLFKRDFAGELLDRFRDLRLVDYGFVYRRDPFPQDDLTWFLLQKSV